MELTQVERDFANKRMHYYVNTIGLDSTTASKIVNEELKQQVLVSLKEERVNKVSPIANYVQTMHKLNEQVQKQT